MTCFAMKKVTSSPLNLERAQREAIAAARDAGALMRQYLSKPKRALAVTQHDIKLALDVRCQGIIQKRLLSAFPQTSLLGEEGDARDIHSEYRWVVDPIDGTVNFAYGIPHASVSIALQQRLPTPAERAYEDSYCTVVGVVLDPFADELWTAIRGRPAKLNGRNIKVSRRPKLTHAIVSIGFAKTAKNLKATIPYFLHLVHQVRKIRIMGSAALALSYVACGRFDAYIERGIRLWDIAAGGLIVECAGGNFWHKAVGNDHTYRMIASNNLLKRQLRLPD